MRPAVSQFRLSLSFASQSRLFSCSPTTTMSERPRILSTEEISPSEAKWITLKRIHYTDARGTARQWEYAERKTRKSTGVDAVAVFAVIRSETNAFPPSTVIIEQYRPPIDKYIVELPAGLIDEGESAEDAAIRELEEETDGNAGYIADHHQVMQSSPIIVSDPGMTNANMKLVVVRVTFPGELEEPSQKLDPGESIVRRVVPLSKLSDEMKAYEAKADYLVDARLAHLVSGYALAHSL